MLDASSVGAFADSYQASMSLIELFVLLRALAFAGVLAIAGYLYRPSAFPFWVVSWPRTSPPVACVRAARRLTCHLSACALSLDTWASALTGLSWRLVASGRTGASAP